LKFTGSPRSLALPRDDIIMFITSLILIAIGLVALGVIIGRHLGELRVLNVESLPGAREKKVKQTIIADRMRRMGREKMVVWSSRLAPLAGALDHFGERMRKHIARLELSYEQAKRLALGSRGKRTAQIVGLLREAEELAHQDQFENAENKYIAVVTLDPKNVDAYEGLGNLYMKMKKFEEAREAFSFILKMRKADASVETSLGEVALAEGKPEVALPHFKRAVDRRPGNPKYLDFYIETALAIGSKKDAERGLSLMRATNPENQKIAEWQHRIEDTPDT